MKLQADMHTHTIASTHAYSTITENCKWASLNGIKAVAMTDHGVNMPDSPHIWHFENQRILPRKIEGTVVIKGIEADIIDFDGSIDVPKWLLKDLEWVIASMHKQTTPSGSEEEITLAYENVMKDPNVDMIGHPTTDFFKCDLDRLAKMAKEYNKIIEINESSVVWKKGSRENSYTLLRACMKYGTMISVDTDSHFCQLIGKTPEVSKIIEEVGFPESLIINSDWEKLRAWISEKRGIADL